MRHSAPAQTMHLPWKTREDSMQAETTTVGDSIIVAEVIGGQEHSTLSAARNPEQMQEHNSPNSSPVSTSYGPLDEVEVWTRRLQEALDEYDRHDLKLQNEMEEQAKFLALEHRAREQLLHLQDGPVAPSSATKIEISPTMLRGTAPLRESESLSSPPRFSLKLPVSPIRTAAPRSSAAKTQLQSFPLPSITSGSSRLPRPAPEKGNLVIALTPRTLREQFTIRTQEPASFAGIAKLNVASPSSSFPRAAPEMPASSIPPASAHPTASASSVAASGPGTVSNGSTARSPSRPAFVPPLNIHKFAAAPGGDLPPAAQPSSLQPGLASTGAPVLPFPIAGLQDFGEGEALAPPRQAPATVRGLEGLQDPGTGPRQPRLAEYGGTAAPETTIDARAIGGSRYPSGSQTERVSPSSGHGGGGGGGGGFSQTVSRLGRLWELRSALKSSVVAAAQAQARVGQVLDEQGRRRRAEELERRIGRIKACLESEVLHWSEGWDPTLRTEWEAAVAHLEMLCDTEQLLLSARAGAHRPESAAVSGGGFHDDARGSEGPGPPRSHVGSERTSGALGLASHLPSSSPPLQSSIPVDPTEHVGSSGLPQVLSLVSTGNQLGSASARSSNLNLMRASEGASEMRGSGAGLEPSLRQTSPAAPSVRRSLGVTFGHSVELTPAQLSAVKGRGGTQTGRHAAMLGGGGGDGWSGLASGAGGGAGVALSAREWAHSLRGLQDDGGEFTAGGAEPLLGGAWELEYGDAAREAGAASGLATLRSRGSAAVGEEGGEERPWSLGRAVESQAERLERDAAALRRVAALASEPLSTDERDSQPPNLKTAPVPVAAGDDDGGEAAAHANGLGVQDERSGAAADGGDGGSGLASSSPPRAASAEDRVREIERDLARIGGLQDPTPSLSRRPEPPRPLDREDGAQPRVQQRFPPGHARAPGDAARSLLLHERPRPEGSPGALGARGALDGLEGGGGGGGGAGRQAAGAGRGDAGEGGATRDRVSELERDLAALETASQSLLRRLEGSRDASLSLPRDHGSRSRGSPAADLPFYREYASAGLASFRRPGLLVGRTSSEPPAAPRFHDTSAASLEGETTLLSRALGGSGSLLGGLNLNSGPGQVPVPTRSPRIAMNGSPARNMQRPTTPEMVLAGALKRAPSPEGDIDLERLRRLQLVRKQMREVWAEDHDSSLGLGFL